METPFDLRFGLRLERAGALLPWGSSIQSLCAIAGPEIYRHPSTTYLRWKDERVFGGLSVHVDLTGAAWPGASYLHRTSTADSAQAEYDELLFDLSSRLGAAHSSVIDEWYPWTRWVWADVVVSLRIAQRFVEYVAFMVSKGIVR
jgi:hypothetical protein